MTNPQKGVLTKADLAEKVFNKLGFSQRRSMELVELVLEEMKQHLEQGQDVKISGFGKFTVRDKRARLGRNPQTNEAIEISARKVVTFKPSEVLKEALASTPSNED